MKPLLDLATWLLDKDVRAKNAISFAFGIVAVIIFYFIAIGSDWFADINRRGNLAVGISTYVVQNRPVL